MLHSSNWRQLLFPILALALIGPSVPAWTAGGRAISLNAAAAAAKAGRAGGIESLCGITRITGYLADDTNRDIILIGRADPSLPALHLDDFCVALRNVWLTYARVKGRTRYYSPPGCSIDPDPAVLRELQQFSAEAGGSAVAGADYAIDEWSAIGRRPQNVRAMGVPFDSHFARVMVDADYYMKRLTNGSVALGIPGFQSLAELTEIEVRKALLDTSNPPLPAHSLNRFWFSPGESTYDEDDGVVTLTTCRVKLLTEEEFLTEHGSVAGMGRPSPLASRYARSFTDHYDQIAAARPVYAELEGLFRAVAVARLMKEAGVGSGGLTYLLREHRLKVTPVSRQVLGLTRVRHISENLQTQSGGATVSVILQSCGGVSMDVRPKRIARRAAPKSAARANRASPTAAVRRPTSLKKTVLSARKSPGALSWDFPLDK